MSKRLDLSKFRGDDSDDDGDLPLVPKRTLELDPLKSKTFSLGNTKKTKRDLEREAEEKKRLDDEEATKLALEEFSQAFAGQQYGAAAGTSGGGGWGTRGRGSSNFVRAGGDGATRYLPQSRNVEPAVSSKPFVQLNERPSSPPQTAKPKGKRAMDAFLEEIKNNQDAREAKFGKLAKREGSSVTALAAHNGVGGSRLENETTNLFILNLPSSVTEASMGKFFAKIGPVGTVKIMWPRGDEEFSHMGVRNPKPGLTGFVCYMKRSDAEKAIREYDGAEWGGNLLRVNWSRAVPIPKIAAYRRDPSPLRGQVTTRSRSRSRSRTASPTPRHRVVPSDQKEYQQFWFDKVPPEQTEFIQAVADRIREHGPDFRSLLAERESNNPKFAFMIDEQLAEHHIFEYLLDPRYRFPEPPFKFEDDGFASVYSSDSAEDSDKEKTNKVKLGRSARRRFEAMLRAMSGKRVEIARSMEFAMKHAEAANEVAEIVSQSLQVDETPIPRKISRLHLISDILHNSASPLPNVWRYRQEFEKRLPLVFCHFAEVYDRLLAYSGPIAAEVFRQQVEAVLTIWERWIVFTTDVHEVLKDLLYGRKGLESIGSDPRPTLAEAQLDLRPPVKSSGFKSSFKPIGESVAPTESQVSGTRDIVPPKVDTYHEIQNLNGEALEDVDGEVMDDVDGEVMDDVDGEAMDDVDGEAMDDVDGEAIDE